jgi:sialate O-acetylesterase
MKKLAVPLILFIFFISPRSVLSKISLPAIFNNHMVLQQKSQIKLWGWAKPRESVTIISSWDATPITVKADNRANWSATIKTPSAGGPHTLTFVGSNTVVLEDILIGEVWLCSGQSNMEWSARLGIDDGTEHVLNANYPGIRLFSVDLKSSTLPQLDCHGEWTACTPQTMIDFSAVGYFFGRQLYENLNVPIGLINSSWGGTPAESWTNPKIIEQDDILKQAAAQQQEVPWCPTYPGATYNTMIKPLIPFTIAGAIWYQGESNVVTGDVYDQTFPAMIQNWGDEWGYNFPFYYVQIAPYKYGKPYEGAVLRDAQRKSLTVPNTGMVVISDIGDLDDIHPRNKLDVGERLANWALAKTYGKNDSAFSGPLYRDMKIENNRIRLYFDYAESGLLCHGDELTHFEIAGEDNEFVPAHAKIDGQTIIVSAKSIKHPKTVRFAWDNLAEPNLFNGDGFPASCFQTSESVKFSRRIL